jgi:hypothetical protein
MEDVNSARSLVVTQAGYPAGVDSQVEQPTEGRQNEDTRREQREADEPYGRP